MSRLGSIEPVGILKAWTAKVRMKRARMTATTIDSRYSRPTDFLKAASGAASGLSLIRTILADSGRDPAGGRSGPPVGRPAGRA